MSGQWTQRGRMNTESSRSVTWLNTTQRSSFTFFCLVADALIVYFPGFLSARPHTLAKSCRMQGRSRSSISHILRRQQAYFWQDFTTWSVTGRMLFSKERWTAQSFVSFSVFCITLTWCLRSIVKNRSLPDNRTDFSVITVSGLRRL